MNSSKYEIHSSDSNIHIHINSISTSLNKEIFSQLKSKPNLTLTTSQHHSQPSLQVCHIYIHYLEPQKNPQESQSELNNVVNYCLKNYAKLILVVPSKTTPQKQKAIEIIQESAHERQLQYFLYSLNTNSSTSENAAQIISHFYYGHQATLPSKKTQSNLIKPKAKLSATRFLLYIFGLMILPYILLLFQFIAFLSLNWVTLSLTVSGEMYMAANYAKSAATLSTVILPQTNILPGVKSFLALLGIPLIQVNQASQNLSDSLIGYRNTIDFIYKNGVKNTRDLQSLFTSNSDSTGVLQSSLKDLYLQSTGISRLLLQLGQQVSATHTVFYKLSQLGSEYEKFIPTRKINYLIVLQDSAELRPTGGFVDSFIYLTLDKGQVTQVQMFSSTQADSHLIGQVIPPNTLQAMLGGTQWLIRDSNWDPDFPESAKRISWFLDKELSLPVDVVVSMNTSIIPGLLKITGPVKIANFKDPITSDNYSQKYRANVISTNQNNYIMDVVKAIISNGRYNEPQISELFQLLTQSFESRQLLISPINFSSAPLEEIGWNGGVRYSNCSSTKSCFKDYLYVVDSNIGLTKNDGDVSRSSSIKITLSPSQISSAIKLHYANGGKTDSLNLAYKDYLRIFLPPLAVLDTISLSGKKLIPANYTVTYEHNLQVVSTQIVVPAKGETDLDLTYHQSLSTTQPFHYQLDLPNQPGKASSPLGVDLDFPPNWLVTSYTQVQSPVPPVATAGQLRYNGQTGQLTKLELDISSTP